ncbi:hypothetical protein BDV23DRAFT_149365 [Aspergillus alliaceus]|uniref:Uncharacterized protein n=1 Tax=Petromyces alliaceus TaxID=209559 RepID=A0A5N7CI32_PETAA|nr:hypothetical protein BDV23DRAFT_149365 [Aspergillus alliaceus]
MATARIESSLPVQSLFFLPGGVPATHSLVLRYGKLDSPMLSGPIRWVPRDATFGKVPVSVVHAEDSVHLRHPTQLSRPVEDVVVGPAHRCL